MDGWNNESWTLQTVWPGLKKFHDFGKCLQIFGNIIHVYLVKGQNFQLTLAKFKCFGANFYCYKWSNIENTIWLCGRTAYKKT